MTTSELNRLIQAYKHVKAAIQDADIPDDVLETLPREWGDARQLMTTGELNRLIRAYKRVVVAVDEADIEYDALAEMPRNRENRGDGK